METEQDWSDFFAAAVPAGVIFDMEVVDLRVIAQRLENAEHQLDPTAELCFIGLVAYFEGFCKNHFASLINIHPELIRNLEAAGRSVALSAADLLDVDEPIRTQLGFLVADQFDFGTPKSINGLYGALLKRTPFGREDSEMFGQILDDRHLLVHHGGIFGPRYSGERFIKREVGRRRLFMDSLLVTSEQVLAAGDFLVGISRKLRSSTQDALRESVKASGRELRDFEERAIDALGWTFDQDGAG